MTLTKPRLSFFQIFNMSFGFLGIQMGFALQNANASRILQSFGADVHSLSWFWIIPPLMGLIVQPIIGHYSDKTWTRMGRRKPYFLAGALLSALGLILMPQAGIFASIMPALWIGAGFLMIMDASFNIAMEPFRALVADILPSDQRTLGYSAQTVLIGIGAVIGSWLPYALSNWFRVSSEAASNEVPYHIILSFIIGAMVMIGAVMVTIFSVKEFTPEQITQFEQEEGVSTEQPSKGLVSIFSDFAQMPKTMRQLAWVQFFSWFALFGMWVFSTPAIAHHIYGTPLVEYNELTETQKKIYQEAGDWVGIIFGVYNGVSAIFAFFLPWIAKRIGRKKTQCSCTWHRWPRIDFHLFLPFTRDAYSFYDWCGYCLGQHPGYALCHTRRLNPCQEDGSVYGNLQLLHRTAPDSQRHHWRSYRQISLWWQCNLRHCDQRDSHDHCGNLRLQGV